MRILKYKRWFKSIDSGVKYPRILPTLTVKEIKKRSIITYHAARHTSALYPKHLKPWLNTHQPVQSLLFILQGSEVAPCDNHTHLMLYLLLIFWQSPLYCQYKIKTGPECDFKSGTDLSGASKAWKIHRLIKRKEKKWWKESAAPTHTHTHWYEVLKWAARAKRPKSIRASESTSWH